MRPVEDKECCNYIAAHGSNGTTTCNLRFQKGNGADKAWHHRRKALASCVKATPSKWDDAQKWLVGLSGGRDHGVGKNKPRNSNADDRRLLGSASRNGRDSCSSIDGGGLENVVVQDQGETKKIDCEESMWSIKKIEEDSMMKGRPVSVRDIGTEMTPMASKEPSRNATPLGASTPVLKSPLSSRPASPGRCRQEDQSVEAVIFRNVGGNLRSIQGEKNSNGSKMLEGKQIRNTNSLESRAMAWDEAERAKYMARYKREEVKIEAWENHETRKAEMEMRRMEVKAERMKSRAQEKLANKMVATRRIAEEKRGNAEAKLNERAAKTSDRSDYIRRSGHLPTSFFFKLPSLCNTCSID